MTRLNVNIGPFAFNGGAFVPTGRVQGLGGGGLGGLGRETSYGSGVYSALVIVGLEGIAGEEFTENDVVEIVRTIRIEQAGDPGASFLHQRGLYKHKETGQIVEENSVRIIILNITGESDEEFRANMVALAEALREEFNQREVIVEFQMRGVTQEVVGIVE